MPSCINQAAPEVLSALGAMLNYLRSLQLASDLLASHNVGWLCPSSSCSSSSVSLSSDPSTKSYVDATPLQLDAQTLTHLNLLTNDEGGTESDTLHSFLNRCILPSGKRLLRSWLVAPLTNVSAIEQRYDAVQELLMDGEFYQLWASWAKSMPDTERILVRIRAGRVKPRELVGLLHALGGVDAAMQQMSVYVRHNHTTGAVATLLDSIPVLNPLVNELQDQFFVRQADQSFEPRPGVDRA